MKENKKKVSIDDWSKAIQSIVNLPSSCKDNPPVADGDLRSITLTLDVIFKKSKIATKWDEFGNTLATRDGFVMIIHEQARIYKDEETTFLGTSVIHRDENREV